MLLRCSAFDSLQCYIPSILNFSTGENLCLPPYRFIYFENIRNKEKRGSTFASPYEAVSTETIYRWLIQVFSMSGGMSTFSTCVPTKEILRGGH